MLSFLHVYNTANWLIKIKSNQIYNHYDKVANLMRASTGQFCNIAGQASYTIFQDWVAHMTARMYKREGTTNTLELLYGAIYTRHHLDVIAHSSYNDPNEKPQLSINVSECSY